ncbi:MAG: hypothetical protein CVV24_05695 [Ignavibacteriae bacterium HGW-Ignavibacteriae-3]|nr:MAG: hypothetical protein CVV24_05695 [Ignavibacteriae bacterium HGW-Ignavibacteriae-3]
MNLTSSKSFLFMLGLFFLINGRNYYAETEPNNTYQQANTLGLNASDSGALNDASQSLAADWDDWWKITLSSDGSLYISLNSSAGLDVDLFIFDINGTSQIASGSRYGTSESVYHTALKAGTYYIRAYKYSGTGTYTITSKFTAAPYSNDSEPNDTYQTSITLALNSQSTGHIKYYQSGSTDWEDWWKVVIPADGSFRVVTESDSADIDLSIYDINGTTSIVSASTYGLTEQIQFNSLMPGTYFVRVYGYNGHGGYKITSTYTQTSINGVSTNDLEKNDSYSTAVNYFTFSTAGSSSNYGHLGYYSNGYTDWEDWWSVTTGTNGKLVVKIESNPTLDVDIYLYDVNGTSSIKSASTYGSSEQLTFDNLAPGKYYIRVYRYSGYGSYKITEEFSTPSLSNDSENNDTPAKAVTIIPETKMTGHLGYYSNSYTDYDDYYVFTLTSTWDSLYIRTDSEPPLDTDLYLYVSPTSSIASSSTYGTKEILKYPNIPAGTYYIRVWRYSGQGGYAIKITNRYPTSPLTSVESEKIEIPTAFSLSQNYPNPFNPTTTIRYAIPVGSFVELKIFDLLGNEIKSLVKTQQAAGNYEVEFNASNLSSGIYFYRLKTDNYTESKKLVLMK